MLLPIVGKCIELSHIPGSYYHLCFLKNRIGKDFAHRIHIVSCIKSHQLDWRTAISHAVHSQQKSFVKFGIYLMEICMTKRLIIL